MRALLMHPDQDFDKDQSLQELMYHSYASSAGERRPLSSCEGALLQDLELDTLLHAMAGDDRFLCEVARTAILSGPRNNVKTVMYRQQVLKDCLKNEGIIREVYDLTVRAVEQTKKRWWGLSSKHPPSLLHNAIDMLGVLLSMLRGLRGIAEEQADQFESEAFTALLSMLRKELSEDYLARIENHLTESKFRKGISMSAALGEWNESSNYVLHKASGQDLTFLQRVLGKSPAGYTFQLAEHDFAGERILLDMQNTGIRRVAIALAQSADHVLSFFRNLRTELAFYVGCLNLHEGLEAKGEPLCFPVPVPAGEGSYSFSGLFDVCLSLHTEHRVVGNTVNADGKNLTIITGANEGGKSTFLRSIGLAQLMMGCGMFVGAETFKASFCPALFTHYEREEDPTMKSGKLDEELARMSEIVDQITPFSMVLFNESFAATNEREGSEIARQIVSALMEKEVRIFYVTHLYEFARGFFGKESDNAIFLRAQRDADGTRSFRLLEGGPLDTSYGEDLYRQVFGG